MYNDIKSLSFLYFKKLFNLKNITLFLVSLLIFSSVWIIIRRIIINSASSSLYSYDKWAFTFYFVWIGIIINYSYVFLKKVNFSKVEKWKNTGSNIIIISIFSFVMYFGIWICTVTSFDFYKQNRDYFKNILKVYFAYIFLITSQLLFISFFKYKHYYITYIIMIAFAIINFAYLLLLETEDKNSELLIFSKINIFLYLNASLFFILFSANIFRRINFKNNNSVKT